MCRNVCDWCEQVKIAARIGTHTGGVGFSTSVTPKLHSPDSNYSFMMHGKALSSKVHDMTAIMSELLLRANFDNKARVSAMVKEMIAGMEEEVVTSGHSVVRSHIVSALDPSGWVEEQMGGVSALEVQFCVWRSSPVHRCWSWVTGTAHAGGAD